MDDVKNVVIEAFPPSNIPEETISFAFDTTSPDSGLAAETILNSL